MKNERRSGGHGVPAAERLLGRIAIAKGAHLEKKDAEYIIRGGSIDDEISISTSPTDHVQWRTRLEWLEKQAANFLLKAPLTYSGHAKIIAGHRVTQKALRLSFGLCLSVGRPLRQRFTAYLFLPDGKTELQIPKDDSIEGMKNVRFLSQSPLWGERALGKLVPLIEQACERYSLKDEVKAELSALSRKRREDLWYLDNLYMRREGFNDHLYGLPPKGTSGSAAITQEYQNCQSLILEQYFVRIEVTPLSLGILSS